MSRLISRRIVLCLAGGALAAPKFSWAANELPTLLDHILLGCSDLDRGVTFVLGLDLPIVKGDNPQLRAPSLVREPN